MEEAMQQLRLLQPSRLVHLETAVLQIIVSSADALRLPDVSGQAAAWEHGIHTLIVAGFE
jgi:hypothetical protein